MRTLDNTSGFMEIVETMAVGALVSPILSARVEFCQLPKEALSIKAQLLPCREAHQIALHIKVIIHIQNMVKVPTSLVEFLVPWCGVRMNRLAFPRNSGVGDQVVIVWGTCMYIVILYHNILLSKYYSVWAFASTDTQLVRGQTETKQPWMPDAQGYLHPLGHFEPQWPTKVTGSPKPPCICWLPCLSLSFLWPPFLFIWIVYQNNLAAHKPWWQPQLSKRGMT